METHDIQTILEYLKALADESRLKLLGILAGGEYSVGDLADLLELKEPTVSHHLARLQQLDLVEMQPYGTTHLYSLNRSTLRRISREMFTLEQVAGIGEQVAYADWEQKVLRSYLDGERLTKIPETRKKREVILRWLAGHFAPGRRYGELELNNLLKRHHPDAATLRRELVSSKLMQREQSVYWLTER